MSLAGCLHLKDTPCYASYVPSVALTSTAQGKAHALALAQTYGFTFETDPRDYDFVLYWTGERLELRESHTQTKPLYIDFSRGKAAYRAAGRKLEPLARAVGVKGAYRPYVIDATAGLGQDALVLAASGCKVLMLERSPVIAALLADGLRRLDTDIAGNLSLSFGEAGEQLSVSIKPDVIYLDPMYPDSGKSAAKRKSMRIFRELVGDDLDATHLLETALGTAQKRVVVKRPLKAPALKEKPSSQLKGKTTRFDIYLV